MELRNDPSVNFYDVIDDNAPRFNATFRSLLDIMRIQGRKRKARDEKRASQAVASQTTSQSISSVSTITLKRPPPSPIRTNIPFSKRIKSDSPSPPPKPPTPNRPTRPIDPARSGSTSASGPEDDTRQLVFDLVRDTLTILRSDFYRIDWQRSGYPVEMIQTSAYPFRNRPDGRHRDESFIVLGHETIRSINDGGLGIQYNDGEGLTAWQPSKKGQPVLSLEAKRRRSNRKDDIELVYEYAGQIFCEMLGQVCYPEFYENQTMGYQEVRPLTLRRGFPLSSHINRCRMLIIVGVCGSWIAFLYNDLLRQAPQ